MLRFLSAQIAQGLVVVWVAFSLSFVLVPLMPGDAVLIRFLNPDMGMAPEDIARIRACYGSDAPVLVQYGRVLRAVLPGDFGYQLQSGIPVWDEVVTNRPPTLRLAGFAVVVPLSLAIAFAATLALFAPLHQTLASLPAPRARPACG